MTENRQTPMWKRGVALASLLSILFLWMASAAHIHIATTQGNVRQECQLCVVGTNPVLTTASPTLLVLDEVVAAFVFAELQSHYQFWLPASSPRAPPFVA
jgi:hypothetical protein